MFIAALFTIARTWNQPRCPSVSEWIGKLRYMSLGEGNGNPLQYSCLKNHMDREAGQATVHGVSKNWT